MIESVHNPKVKRWAELLTRKGREKHGQFLIEGVRLVQEALDSGAPLEAVIWQTGRAFPLLDRLPGTVQRWEVSEAVMKKLTDTQHSQGIAAVVSIIRANWMPFQEKGLYLLVDGVQDPGNLGTIIRAADAAAANGVILGKGTVDLYNPKTVRSTMGSLFHLPVINASLEEIIPRMKEVGYRVIASSLETDKYYHQLNYPEKTAIIVGNEGNGISPNLLALADEKVKIPIYGKAESLNVAIATSLLLYEARKQNPVE